LNLLIYGVLNSVLSSLYYTTLNDIYKETTYTQSNYPSVCHTMFGCEMNHDTII